MSPCVCIADRARKRDLLITRADGHLRRESPGLLRKARSGLHTGGSSRMDPTTCYSMKAKIMLNSKNTFSKPANGNEVARRARGRVVGTLVGLLGTLLVPAMAHASAYGYEYWKAFEVAGYPVPGGQLFHAIEGRGLHIDVEGANFVSAGNLCEASVRFTWGNGAQSYKTGIKSGCSHVGQWKIRFNRNVPKGSACAELWTKNWRHRVARQCHYVS